jgi:hypothetical protein
VIVVDCVTIDDTLELAEDYMYGRTRHVIFGTEDSARKSLTWGSQRLWDFYRNQAGGGDSNGRTQTGEINKAPREISKNYNVYFYSKLYLL